MKANKDTVTVANAGIGAASHLYGMLLMSAIGTLVTVPYKGTGPAMTDLLGGEVDAMCDQTTNTTKQIERHDQGLCRDLARPSRRAAGRADRCRRRPCRLPGRHLARRLCAEGHAFGSRRAPVEVASRSRSGQRRRPLRRTRHRALAEADATPAALKAKLESEIARWKPVIEAADQFADLTAHLKECRPRPCGRHSTLGATKQPAAPGTP